LSCRTAGSECAAEKLGLPFVPPYLAHNGSFRQGANFAVAGATSLDASFFSDIPGVGKFVLNTSSSVQLGWFDSLKPLLCSPAQGKFQLPLVNYCSSQ
jgi:hypothetical protein